MTDVLVPNIVIEMATPTADSKFSINHDKPATRRGITALTVDIPIPAPPRRSAPPPPSRWKTPEFIFYGVVFLIVVPLMIKSPVDVSRETHPNYPLYQARLSEGWIAGRKVDNSDRQYRSFRDNIPALAFLSLGHLALGKAYQSFVGVVAGRTPSRIPFSLTFSVLMLFGLHGASALKIIAIFSLNYALVKFLHARPITPYAIWGFNVAVLFLNEIYDGYRFASLHSGLSFLDSMRGFYPRWNVSFNITILRLISFSMDYHWACIASTPPQSIDPLNEKERISSSHPLAQYNYVNYLAYAIYPPLYITGPIMTFNNFVWQMRKPLQIPSRLVIHYAIRFFACFMTMELVLHYMYVVAIKDTKAWRGDSPAEISLIGFWNLIIVWLKLLIPWRFFRLWALADGIDPPENMVRCMANNYSAVGFWRAWHRSYNIWVTKYLYIPVGGSNRPIIATLVVFTFVALWHDLSFKLLTWGWLVSLFVIPEMLAAKLLPASQFGHEPWYRHICAVGAVFNLFMMTTANLVGFVVGVDGIWYFAQELLGTWQGLQFLSFTFGCLFVGVQIMFEYRAEEMRKGIYRRF